MKIRPIAFVLPQFHPIPENDEWWGEGFTEWTNVKKAKPLFKGHYQPHVPTELGYYDLRDEEARENQAKLAQEYGIHGFCFYHYWFNSKRLLNYPIDEILRLQKPQMPFMLCWANENWTRTWDGLDKHILIKQEYSEEDDRNHMRWLCENVFSDPRYIKVNDCPVFLVYRFDLFPDINRTAQVWREVAKTEFGYKDLYLGYTESFNTRVRPNDIGFDAAIEFSPHQIIKNKFIGGIFSRVLNKLGLNKFNQLDVRDYKKGVEESINRELPDYKLFRCVTPSWDNTARKSKQGAIAVGSSPNYYEYWMKCLLNKIQRYSKDENFIFINAMNEWAEGNHLEPCTKYGTGYLRATKNALEEFELKSTTNV